MENEAVTKTSAAAPLEDRIRGVSPLAQIESHAWSEDAWATSERLLDSVEAELALARGRLIYERYLRSGPGGYPGPGANGRPALPFFRRAAELFRRSKDGRGEREALFWVGTLEQVLNHDYAAASLALEEAREQSEVVKDRLVLSCVERHLGFIAFLEGMTAEAQSHLEESVRLRREIDFPAGVAMALVALADFFNERHDTERARTLLDEATALAQANGAAGALEAIEQSRQQLKSTH
jgi:tetratricopeptide (TPR) repeat protein